jgi:hypothetical protein
MSLSLQNVFQCSAVFNFILVVNDRDDDGTVAVAEDSVVKTVMPASVYTLAAVDSESLDCLGTTDLVMVGRGGILGHCACCDRIPEGRRDEIRVGF